MKTQMKWLMFIILANLVTTFVMTTKTTEGAPVFPSVKYMQNVNITGTVDDYEDTFNATELADRLAQTPSDPFSYVFPQISGIINFFNMIRPFFDGFPMLIDYWCGFIPSEGGINIFRSFGNILRVISVIMIATLLLEFFRGVQILP